MSIYKLWSGVAVVVFTASALLFTGASSANAGTIVRLETNWDAAFATYAASISQAFEPLRIEMYDDDDQIQTTVDNFLNYVTTRRYEGTVFHRYTDPASDGIGVLQGGGFAVSDYEPDDNDSWLNKLDDAAYVDHNNGGMKVTPVQTDAPIGIEAVYTHARGTVGVARTTDPVSATSQFYINFVDNSSLDGSYTVMGELIEEAGVLTGMDLIDAIIDPLNFFFGYGDLNDDQFDNTTFAPGADGLRDPGAFGDFPLLIDPDTGEIAPLIITRATIDGVVISSGGGVTIGGGGVPTPEPASLALMAAGAALAGWRRRR